jgi:hypothetical protein
MEHVPSNTVHQTLRERAISLRYQTGLSTVASFHVSQYVLCFLVSFSSWQPRTDCPFGLLTSRNRGFLQKLKFIPLARPEIPHFTAHLIDVRSFFTLLSVSATGPCPGPDAHCPHPHIPFILVFSSLLTSHLRPVLPHRFGLLFWLDLTKITPIQGSDCCNYCLPKQYTRTLCILPIQYCICVFGIIVRTNSEYFASQNLEAFLYYRRRSGLPVR